MTEKSELTYKDVHGILPAGGILFSQTINMGFISHNLRHQIRCLVYTCSLYTHYYLFYILETVSNTMTC